MEIKYLKNTLGFSLIEMVIAVVLIIMIGSISLPIFGHWLAYNKLRQSTLIYKDVLSRAKSRVEETGRMVQVYLREENNGERVDTLDGKEGSTECSEKGAETIYESSFIDAEIIEENGIIRICFEPNGYSTGGLFTIKKNDQISRIKINKHTGFVELLP